MRGGKSSEQWSDVSNEASEFNTLWYRDEKFEILLICFVAQHVLMMRCDDDLKKAWRNSYEGDGYSRKDRRLYQLFYVCVCV